MTVNEGSPSARLRPNSGRSERSVPRRPAGDGKEAGVARPRILRARGGEAEQVLDGPHTAGPRRLRPFAGHLRLLHALKEPAKPPFVLV